MYMQNITHIIKNILNELIKIHFEIMYLENE